MGTVKRGMCECLYAKNRNNGKRTTMENLSNFGVQIG